MSTRLAAIAFLAGAAPTAVAQGHPHFNDGGTLQWYTKLAEAKAAAKKADKLIFIQYGRKACGNCRALVERVLPGAGIKERIGSLAVGLAADCDAPEEAVEAVMRDHLANATALPFVGFITYDGKWVEGYSGYKEAAEFATVLAAAEKSPLLEATAAVRAQLAKLAPAATAAADRGDWKAVLGVVREANKSGGRCPERDAVKAAEKRAREWVAAQFEAAVRDAGSGGDLAPVRKRLADVKLHFAGEPEAADADAGSKAVLRLTQIRDAEAMPNPAHDLRDRAAATFKGTRWAAIFARPGAPPDKARQ